MATRPTKKELRLERDIEEDACTRAEQELGVFSLKLNVKSNTGWPDREFFIPGGKPFLIEFKRPGEPLSRRQELIIERLRYARYDVEVHDNADEAFRAIAKRVDAARISAGRAGVYDKSALGSTLSRPRPGKNVNHLRGVQDTQEKEDVKRHDRRRAFAASAARMASRKKEVERF